MGKLKGRPNIWMSDSMLARLTRRREDEVEFAQRQLKLARDMLRDLRYEIAMRESAKKAPEKGGKL